MGYHPPTHVVLDTQLSQSKQLVEAGPRSFIPDSFCWETRTIVAFHSGAAGKSCPEVLTSGDGAEEIQKLVDDLHF